MGINTSHLQLGKTPQTQGSIYSYDGGMSVHEVHGAEVLDEGVPLSPGGDCGGGPFALIEAPTSGDTEAWIVYDLGHPMYIYEIWARMYFIGTFRSFVSPDGISWYLCVWDTHSWSEYPPCEDVQLFYKDWATVNHYPYPFLIRYIKFYELAIVLVGDNTKLAYFWVVAGGGIYTDNVELGTISTDGIFTNGVRNG